MLSHGGKHSNLTNIFVGIEHIYRLLPKLLQNTQSSYARRFQYLLARTAMITTMPYSRGTRKPKRTFVPYV